MIKVGRYFWWFSLNNGEIRGEIWKENGGEKCLGNRII